jgi:hypothetical protein
VGVLVEAAAEVRVVVVVDAVATKLNHEKNLSWTRSISDKSSIMKVLTIIIILLFSNFAYSQDLEKQKAGIDAEVERISKQTNLVEVNFSIHALKKVLHYISYQYVEDPKGHVKISRRFSYKKDTIHQIFYLKDGWLIFASKTITTYFTDVNKTDSITWSGNFYFSKGKLIDHSTLGHGKSEQDGWIPGPER